MDTLYRRDLWKKKSFYGYKPAYVKTVIEKKQNEYDREISQLEQSLENLAHESDALKNEMSELEKIRASKTVNPQELIDQLAFAYIKAITQHLRLKDQLEKQNKDLLIQLEEKQAERDQLILKIKNGIQELNIQVGEIGGE